MEHELKSQEFTKPSNETEIGLDKNIESGNFLELEDASIELTPKGKVIFSEDNLEKITLSFNEGLQYNTTDAISIYKIDENSGVPVRLSISRSLSYDNKVVEIIPSDRKTFHAHTLFRLNISTSLKSENGLRLRQPIEAFFYTKKGEGDSEKNKLFLEDGKKRTVVISDIHMGDKRSIENEYGWFINNRNYLEKFLDYLITNAKYFNSLVIAGDFFDEWVAPMDVSTFPIVNGVPLSQSEFIKEIIKENQEIINKIKKLHDCGVNVIYTPGNHDMLVTKDDFDSNFGTGVVVQARDVPGLGRYTDNDIVIEHGHRYDYFNSPDPLSNKNEAKDDSILPPGFFVSKIASSSDKAGLSERLGKLNINYKLNTGNGQSIRNWICDLTNWYELSLGWNAILKAKPVKLQDIKTGIDGYTRDYKIKEISDWYASIFFWKWWSWRKPLLYKDSNEEKEWAKRLEKNKAHYLYFETGALAGVWNGLYPIIASNEYLEHKQDTPKRIIVFGHTHEGTIKKIGNNDCIYANSGTWVDEKWASGMPQRTFILIEDRTINGKGIKDVSLYSYLDGDNFEKLNSAQVPYV